MAHQTGSSRRRLHHRAVLLSTLLGVGMLCACTPRDVPALAPRADTGTLPSGGAAGVHGKPPPVPKVGAYTGAWVQPKHYTQQGYIDAVDSLEAQLGRRLDVVQTYLRWATPFPSRSDRVFARQGSYLMLSWASADIHAVANGSEDRAIRRRARQVRAYGSPMFLRFRWEMDRPNLTGTVHSSTAFRRAWRRVHGIFDQMHVHNVAWVWCPTAAGFATGRAQAYYPGSSQVDWVCADGYPGPQVTPLGTVLGPFLRWARSVGKPAMVGEFAIQRSVPPRRRAAWLTAASTALRRDPQVKAAIYFDSDGDGSNLYFSDLLDSDRWTLDAYRTWVRTPYWDPQHLVVGR